MDARLLHFFQQIHPMTEEEIRAIDATMTTKVFKKGTILLREGQITTDSYFVLEGVIRQYYLVDGTEKTTDFYQEKEWVVSLNGLEPNQPARHYLECSTDCTVLLGDSQKGEELFTQFPNLGIVSRKLMEQTFAEQQKKIEAFTIHTPAERYVKLCQHQPELFQKIPQYQIASYIGVTPESLSRIKKRLITDSKK